MRKQFYIFSGLLGLAIWAFLQSYFAYYFFYVEQSQLFLLSKAYWIEKASKMGGVCEWCAEAWVQFFAYPYLGALIVAFIVFASACLTGAWLRRVSGSGYVAFGGWLPALALCWASLDFNYNEAGNMAYLLCVGMAWGYTYVKPWVGRVLVGVLCIGLLSWMGGAAFAPLAVMLFFYEIGQKGRGEWRISFVYLFIALAIGYGFYRMGWSNSFGDSFLPIRYYMPKLDVPSVVYSAWWMVLVLTLLGCLVGKWNWTLKGWKRTSVWITECLLLIWIAYWGVSKYGDWKTLAYMKLDYYSRTEQWDKIIQDCEGRLTNYLYMTLLSRALAEEGRLADDLFRFDIRSEKGLGVPWNRTEALSVLLSDLFYTCGNTSLSQRMAFEGDVSAHGSHNVRMIQRLVKTNLILGAYPVADKYLRLLEQSPIYREWAEAQRPFLYNDEKVEADAELELRRALLPSPADTSQMITSGNEFVMALINPIQANPEKAQTAFQYLAGYFLLAKDMGRFVSLMDEYRGTHALPTLPVRYQEALIVAFENDSTKWNAYGVHPEMVARYKDFKRQILANRGSGSAANLLRRSYGETYWFYVMFN